MQKIIGIGLVSVFAFMACSPRDIYVDSMKTRLEQGKLVEVTKAGERLESCPGDKPDWTDIRLTSSEYNKSVMNRLNTKSEDKNKQEIFTYGGGSYLCLRVGKAVNVTIKGDLSNRFSGRVVVDKISLVNVESLQKNAGKIFKVAAKDKATLSKFSYGLYQDAKRTLYPDDHGIMNIVHFHYLKGTSPDEKEIVQKAQFEEVAVGKMLSSCGDRKPWDSMVVPVSFQKAIFEQGLRSWPRRGSLNCLTVNPDLAVDIKTAPKPDAQSCGKIKVTGIVKIPFNLFDIKDLNLGQTPAETILTYLSLSTSSDEYVTVTDFEYVEGTGVACTETAPKKVN